MIGILKYRAGNLTSVSNALDRLGAVYIITDSVEELNKCEAIIFPGVGHAASAMEDLRARGLDSWLKRTDKPVLGICLGMQLLFESTEEGDTETLGLLPGRLQKFDPKKGKVPHMGWNCFEILNDHPVLKSLDGRHFLYYVHGYYAPINKYTLASCSYIRDFSAVVAKDNFMGVQFHPEKSGNIGSMLLQNFLDIIQDWGNNEI